MENLKKSDFFHLEKEERVAAMSINCDGKVKENFTYSRPLDENEIAEKNIEINEALQEIKRLKEEVKDLNAESKEHKELISKNNEEVTNKYVQKKGKVWFILNESTGMIETINEEGYVINEKKKSANYQQNIFNQNRKAV